MTSRKQDTLHNLFKKCGLKFQRNVAVTFDDGEKQEHTTYEVLAGRAAEISSFLVALCEGEQAVAVYSNQHSAFVACLLGVLQLSCAFAPIGTDWPPMTAYRFIKSLSITSILVDTELLGKFQEMLSIWETALPKGNRFKFFRNEVLIRNGFVLLKLAGKEVVVRTRSAFPLAYIMQASGTTGEPKTVKVPHTCIVSNVSHLSSIFQVSQDDAVFLVAPSTFDPFVVQLFLALSTGARLVVVPEKLKMIPSALCRILFDRQKVTVFQPTPSLMYHIGVNLITSKVLHCNSSLRVLAFGGENCPTLPTLRQWTHSECPTNLYNIYGITEVSCWASCHHITQDELYRKGTVCEKSRYIVSTDGLDVGFSQHDLQNNAVPLGVPLRDTVIEVRDEKGELVKEGLGQVFVGGAGRVCLLGSETDVAMTTMRATGDWAFVKQGVIWYCGRKDRQIKRNGKRINLDWVERTISQALGGVVCSLVVEERAQRNRQSLHLFTVARNVLFEEGASRVRKVVQESLPNYAQPDSIHLIPRLSVTSHGKVDKAALLATVRCQRAQRATSTRGFLERVWVEALEVNVSNLPNLFEWSQDDTVAGRDRSSLTSFGGKLQEGEGEGKVRSTVTTEEIQINDSDMFVMTGGSSLAAVRLADNIESWMSQKMLLPFQATELVDIILNKPFRNLCDYVEEKIGENDRSLAEREGTGDVIPVSIEAKYDKFEAQVVEMTAFMTDESDGDEGAVFSEEHPVEAESHALAADRPDIVFCQQSLSHEDQPLVATKRGAIDGNDSKEIVQEPDEPGMDRPSKRAKINTAGGNLSDISVLDSPSGFTVYPRGCYCSVSRGMQKTICPPCQDQCQELRASTEGTVSEDMPTYQLSEKSLVTIEQKWKTSLYKCIDASPLVVFSPERQDGEVYVGSHGHVFMAIRLSDGHVIWEEEVGDRVESSAVLSACGTYVIVGCYDGKVYVFERHSGALVWTHHTEGPIKSSPCVDPQTEVVWVGSHDHHLYGLDVSQRQRVCAVNCGGGSCFSSPRVSRDPHVIYAATLSGLFLAVDADEHTVTWSQQCPKPVFASPVVFRGGVLCTCVDGVVYCFSHQGSRLWECRTNGAVFCTPALQATGHSSEGSIVFGSHDRHVYCLNTLGHVTWTFTADAHVYSTPFIAPLSRATHLPRDKHVRDESLVVFVFSTVGTLFVVDLKSGRLVTSTSLPGEVFSSPVVAGNQVIVGCRNDFLYSLELSFK